MSTTVYAVRYEDGFPFAFFSTEELRAEFLRRVNGGMTQEYFACDYPVDTGASRTLMFDVLTGNDDSEDGLAVYVLTYPSERAKERLNKPVRLPTYDRLRVTVEAYDVPEAKTKAVKLFTEFLNLA